MLGSLKCPNCGAAAPDANATQCAYCRSALTGVSCPSCFGAMFAGMQFCPHCGAKGVRAVGDVTLTCPGCRSDMKFIEVGSTPMFECSGCSSIWVDAAAFTELCLSREQRARVASMTGVKDTSVVPTAGGKVRYVHCVRCKKTMNRENFGRRSGVILDVCRGHGVWFERGELASVSAFIDGGGLERARAEEQERKRKEREKLEREFVESRQRVPDIRDNTPADALLTEMLRKLLT